MFQHFETEKNVKEIKVHSLLVRNFQLECLVVAMKMNTINGMISRTFTTEFTDNLFEHYIWYNQ